MYAQRTRIRVPQGRMPELRSLVETKYIPVVRTRPGFVAAYLLEQVDDEDSAEMIQFWDNHAAAESFMRTGSLAASLQSLAAMMPGIKIERQGYIVRAATGATNAEVVSYAQR